MFLHALFLIFLLSGTPPKLVPINLLLEMLIVISIVCLGTEQYLARVLDPRYAIKTISQTSMAVFIFVWGDAILAIFLAVYSPQAASGWIIAGIISSFAYAAAYLHYEGVKHWSRVFIADAVQYNVH